MKGHHLVSLGLLSAAIVLCGCSRQPNQSNGQSNQRLSGTSPSPSPVPSPRWEPPQAEQIDRKWSSKFKFERKSIKKNHEGNRGYEISAAYPQIASAHTPATRRFNRWIRRKIRSYVAQFKGLEQSAEIHDRKKRLPAARISEGLEIDYRVYYSDYRLISLRLRHTVMVLGQMHPIDYYETINYELKKGHDLHPSDVFRPTYLKVFATYSRKELKDKYHLEDDWSRRGTMPKKHNFNDWNIVPDGILLAFEDYQINAHSFGQAEMIIPFSALKRVLRRRGVTSQFLRKSSNQNANISETQPIRRQTVHHSKSEARIGDILGDRHTLSYQGYTIEKRSKRVRIDDEPEGGSSPSTVDVSYATLKRHGRVVATFDANIYFGMGNATSFGLFPLLGGSKKQLIVSQDIPRGGTQWIANLSPKFHLIFDGPQWGVGREGDDMQIVDLDHDGVFEILVPITAFYGFSAWIPTGRTPLPTVIFKFDPKTAKYLPANSLFPDYLVSDMRKRKEGVSTTLDPIAQPTEILPIVLDYIFAGKEQEAWTFFEESYKLADKQELKARIQTVLRGHAVYRFIYKETYAH